MFRLGALFKLSGMEFQNKAPLMFLPHFDVFCNVSLNRPRATWNLFV